MKKQEVIINKGLAMCDLLSFQIGKLSRNPVYLHIITKENNVSKTINAKCLQKVRTQTPHFIPGRFSPHTHISAAKVTEFGKKYEESRTLKDFVLKEEDEIQKRYETDHNLPKPTDLSLEGTKDL